MIVGLDAKRIVRNATGLGSYGRTLVNDLARLSTPDAPLQLRLYAPDAGRDELRRQVQASTATCFCYPRPGSLLPAALRKALWRSRGIVADLQRDSVQLYHGLSGELPVGISRSGIRSVVTIHDLIFMRHPEYYNPIDRWVYTWKFRQAISQADHIIAISECTKRDIIELGQVDERRITVVYQSYSPRFSAQGAGQHASQVSQHYGLPRRFVLTVGTIEARKNVLLAVKALPLLPADVSLVAVGRRTDYADRVLRYAREHGLADRVRFLHGVTDEELPALYALAEAFVYLSRYEGFGIPIIEAIGMGLPVVACTGSCLEEAGGPDSLYVDPDDEQALARALTSVLCNAGERQRRVELSQQYITRFGNTSAAQQVLAVYERLRE